MLSRILQALQSRLLLPLRFGEAKQTGTDESQKPKLSSLEQPALATSIACFGGGIYCRLYMYGLQWNVIAIPYKTPCKP